MYFNAAVKFDSKNYLMCNMHCYLCTVVVVQYTKKENLFMICYFFAINEIAM